MALVPVIRKDLVRKHFSYELLKEFERFEAINPLAEYFMLDGSHRTTALTLTDCKIPIIIYETDKDIEKAKRLVKLGQVLKNATLDMTLEENCETLNQHFKGKSYFMTVEQKTQRMVNENIIPIN